MEADPRHVELMIKQLGLEHANGLTCPVVYEVPGESPLLGAEYTTQYKSLVARANYLASDRPDIQFAVKQLAQGMASPTSTSFKAYFTWPMLVRPQERRLSGFQMAALRRDRFTCR